MGLHCVSSAVIYFWFHLGLDHHCQILTSDVGFLIMATSRTRLEAQEQGIDVVF